MRRIIDLKAERKLGEASTKTMLPDNPDMEKIEKFVMRANRYAILGESKDC